MALLLLLVLGRAWLEPSAARFARRTAWCMALLFALPILLRLALLPGFPVPTPGGADDYGYLLLADTLRHFRLANPVHPMHQFFETVFVLQQPSYSSIYSPGLGLVLGLGWDLFGHPWAGVLLSVGAFCSLCYWMLRAWTTPGWALVGGILAVAQFGPLNQWTNIYWGGAVAAAAGCLVFGALPRLLAEGRRRDALLLGAGLGLHILTRPFESIFLCLSLRRLSLAGVTPGHRAATRCPVAGHCRASRTAGRGAHAIPRQSGHRKLDHHPLCRKPCPVWCSHHVHGPNSPPCRANQLTTQQRLTYEGQSAEHGEEPETPGRFIERWGYRLRFYRFFFLAPFYLALPFFFMRLREFRFRWLALTVLLFSLGTNFYPYFFPQYIASLTCLLVLAAIAGLERLNRISQEAARWLVLLAVAHFLFWYGLHASGNQQLFRALRPYETWDFVNFGDPEGRIAIDRQLAQIPGQKLVFVRYGTEHRYREWIHNAAGIDDSPVVMALDRDTDNAKLRQYYPGRSVWLLEPDAKPVRLRPYPEDEGPFVQIR